MRAAGRGSIVLTAGAVMTAAALLLAAGGVAVLGGAARSRGVHVKPLRALS